MCNKSDNNLEITSVRSSLDLGNKIWIGKSFIEIVFPLQKPPSRFFIFATRKLWNYLVQIFLSDFHLSSYPTIVVYIYRNQSIDSYFHIRGTIHRIGEFFITIIHLRKLIEKFGKISVYLKFALIFYHF